MTSFQTLGELSTYLEARPGTVLDVVDPGMPLTDYSGAMPPIWDRQPAVRKVVDFIARNVASIPLHGYERFSDGSRERCGYQHPLARSLRSPGGTAKPFRFWYRLQVDGLLYDRWCAVKLTQDGSVVLKRIPPRRFRFRSDGLDEVDAIEVWDKNGRKQTFDTAKFVFDVGYSERSGNGTSPMRTIQALLSEAAESIEYRRNVLRNSARIPAVIERPTPWPSTTSRDRFVASWASFTRDGGRSGSTPILEDGMKISKVDAFNPEQMQDLDSRRLADIEVASSFHIAPELVGARPGNFSNVDAFRQMLWGPSLGPYINAWEQAVDAGVTPELAGGSDMFIEALVEAKLRGSFLEQAAAASTATGRPWMTTNEQRSRFNLADIDGGDDLVTPLNVIIGGQASPRDSAPPKTRLQRDGVQQKSRVDAATEDQVGRLLRKFFRRQRQVVLSALGGKAAVADWWDASRWDRELGDELYRLSVDVARKVGRDVIESIGFAPDLYDEAATLNFLRAVADARAGAINSTTRDQIKAALADEDEENTPAGVFESAVGARAATAAITLATTWSAFATTEGAKQVAGDNAMKTWRVTSNAPRNSHKAMNGETVGVDEKFSNGSDWPGDPVLGADGVAGCTCDVEISIP